MSYPTAIDANVNPGDSLRAPLGTESPGAVTAAPAGVANPDLATFLANSAASLIGAEKTLGLPSSPAAGSVLSRLGNSLIANLQAPVTRIVWLGDSHLDPANGNYLNATGTGPATDGDTWGMVINRMLSLDLLGRYTPAGGGTPLGSFYATFAAGVTGSGTTTPNTSVVAQMQKLQSDYPTSLAGFIVVIAVGVNDINNVIYSGSTSGGIWTTPVNQSWTQAAPTVTMPANGVNATLTMSNVTGIVAGTTGGYNNFLSNTGVPGYAVGPYLIISVNAGANQVTIQGTAQSAPYAGQTYGAGTIWKPAPAAQIDADLASGSPNFGGQLGILVGLNPTLIVLCGVVNPNLLPANSAFSGITTAIWQYWQIALSASIPVSSPLVAGFDMSPWWNDVLTAPGNFAANRYGLKNVVGNWNGAAGQTAKDYAWWNNLHPSSVVHKYLAGGFLEFLKLRGLIFNY